MRLLVTPTTAHLPPDITRRYINRVFAGSNTGGVYGAGHSSDYEQGLGQVVPPTVATAATIAGSLVATTSSIMASLATSATVAAGGIASDAMVLGLSAAVVPVIGAAIAALIGIGIAIANAFKGCGQTCIAATQIANQCDTLLAQNVDKYTSSPIRYASMQAAALNTFDTTWAALQQACGQSSLGAAGQRCITDRQRGACTWKASPGGWNSDGTYTMWGAAGSGSACWNWFVGMRDPIANDPNVQPDPVAGSTVNTSSTSSDTSGVSSVLAPLTGTVSIGTLNIPIWALIAAGVTALMMVKE